MISSQDLLPENANVFSHRSISHTIEIDQYINYQSERLRVALQQRAQQQTLDLMKKYESKAQHLMRRKDEEILKAANRNAELRNCVREMEMERRNWQTAARESEAAATSLSGVIRRLRESASAAAEDAESWCCGGGEAGKMICRCCNIRNSCVIMLPCRHLCSCRDCDAFIDCCPVCSVVKKASLEALL